MMVDSTAITSALDTIAQLSKRGAALAEADVPRMLGRAAALDELAREAGAIESAATDAVKLLGTDPIDTLMRARLEEAATAARRVSPGNGRPSPDAVTGAGRSIVTSLRPVNGLVRAELDNATRQFLDDLLVAPPRSIKAAAIDELRRAISLRSTLELPPLMAGSRRLGLADLPDGDPVAHVRALLPGHLQASGITSEELLVARAAKLVGGDGANMSRLDAAELRTVISMLDDRVELVPGLADTPSGRPVLEVLDEVVAGGDPRLLEQPGVAAVPVADSAVPVASAATPVADATTTVDALGAELRAVLTTPTSAWGGDDWRTVSSILERDTAAGSVLGLPRTLTGARAVERLVRDGARGAGAAATGMERYRTAWLELLDEAVAGAPQGDVAGRMQALVARPAQQLDDAAWTELAALLDSDPTGAVLAGPRKLSGIASLRELALDGKSSLLPTERERYLAAWRTTSGPEAVGAEQRAELVHEFLQRDPDTLTVDEWRRLGALVDGATDRGFLAALAMPKDARDIGNAAMLHARRAGSVDGATRRAFAHAKLQLEEVPKDVARLHGAMHELVDRPLEELGSNDWARVAALLDLDPTGAVLAGPRTFVDGPSAIGVARLMANGRTEAAPSAERMLAAWRAQMSGQWPTHERLVAAGARYAQRDPKTLSRDEWRLIGSMVDLDTSGEALRAPGRMNGVEPLAVLASRSASGQPIATNAAQRSFRAWRLRFDPRFEDARQVVGATRALVERDPGTLTGDEWKLLQTLLDHDSGVNVLRMPEPPKNVPSFRDQVEAGLAGRQVNPLTWRRVTEPWMLHLDGVATDQPKLEAALFEALSPRSGAFDTDALVRLRTVLDADASGAVLETGRAGAAVKSLRNAVADERSASKLTVESAVVDEIRNALAAPAVTERRAAIRAAIDGRGTFPRDVTMVELRAADPNWTLRSSLEQRSIEARVSPSAVRVDGYKAAVELLHKVRELERPADLPAQLERVWADTQRLIDVNVQRLGGKTPRGEVRGYGSHPDYAQVGRIAANLELVGGIVSATSPHRATPVDQVVVRLAQDAAEQVTF